MPIGWGRKIFGFRRRGEVGPYGDGAVVSRLSAFLRFGFRELLIGWGFRVWRVLSGAFGVWRAGSAKTLTDAVWREAPIQLTRTFNPGAALNASQSRTSTSSLLIMPY